MTAPHPGSGPEYAWATDPVPDGIPIATQPPLPTLWEPTQHPAAPTTHADAPGVHEPLVPVTHPRIRNLAVYFHAGWTAAIPDTLVRVGVAERLAAVAGGLPAGFGLAVFDAWRPLALQHELYAAAYADPELPPGYIEVPSRDPATPPPHLTGGTVDLTLTWQGRPLALGTSFDEFTPMAHAAACEQRPGSARELRRMLHWTMRHQGFIVADCEWWHFEHGTSRASALTGEPVRYGVIQP